MTGPTDPAPTDPAPAPFDPVGPLPRGTTVLEASAGTGKTYAIAGLVTRYVAEGEHRIEELLVVTFGRAATAELRDRVRARMVEVRDALADPAAARKWASDRGDLVLGHLAAGPAGEVEGRRHRLAEALAAFDAATVATIHQFCQQVLTSLGTAADVDPQARLVEDVSDLLEEVCDDLYVRFALRARPGFTRAQALRIAREAVARPDAVLEPVGAEDGSRAALRVRFARAVRTELAARKRAGRILSFDDLLLSLREVLLDPVAGPVACERLRSRYGVVLVDEFQDTDAVQWDVLRTAFHGRVPLVLIGDPKQAIYAFRGADVRTYLTATGQAHENATLATNHRSDPRVVAGVAALLRGASLGEEGIVVREVRAAHERAALLGSDGAEDPGPVRLRVLGRDGLPSTRGGLPVVAAVREAVAADVADQVAAVLAEGLRVRPHRGGEERALEAGDVAVLVRTGAQAVLVQQQLQARGIPCVLSRGSSVFSTEAAQDWTTLLEAVEQPHRTRRVRRLALSSFVGFTATELDARGDRGMDELAGSLRHWAGVLEQRGVAALLSAVAEQRNLAERLLAVRGGERRWTDLRHIGETLHAESTRAGGAASVGLAGLLSWLRARVEDAAADQDAERSRRLDTDRTAVQVATVHTSKGLEFEVVCVPYGWDSVGGAGGGSSSRRPERYPVAHDPAGRRVVHVGGPGSPRYDEVCAAADTEDAGEELRLLYVALTRAVSRLLVWWAPATTSRRGALHRLLMAADPQSVPPEPELPSDAELRARLAALLGTAGTPVRVEAVRRAQGEPVPHPPAAAVEIVAPRTFTAEPDPGWRRTSYSGLTRAAHEAAHAGAAGSRVAGGAPAPATSEADVAVLDDELDLPTVPPGPDRDPVALAWAATPSPLADLPAGAGFGTLVHAVLEHFDPAVPDRPSHLAALAREQYAGGLAEPLAAALQPVLSTPLGPLLGGASLADVAARDRLDELEFELPLGGGAGAVPGSGGLLGDVAGLLRAHLAPEDPVAPYAELLHDPLLAAQPLRGYLTGSIDAVLRRSGADGPRFLVVDYKTNRLAPPGEELTAWHYRREALDEAVLAAHYPLQALMYCVALHRFLRWRQPGYDPATHLSGVLYLFLRGLCGPGVTADARGEIPGVWSWRPPAGLVLDLSDLLAGVRP
ncbi:UvrD-helicase domain-containing protein [Kineococcus gynurae]|uniref:RecBCD enzyme subunit RecB n=1 Tax=Kineococcus gynurae TaxID=452979 RepID=A0ABV5LP44_9ACTN